MNLHAFVQEEINHLEDKILILQEKTAQLLKDGQTGTGEYLRLCGMEQAYSAQQARLVMQYEKVAA